MNANWKDMTIAQKILFVITCIAAVLVIAILVKPDLFPVNITYPAIAVVTLGDVLVYWKKNRKWAYLLLVGAVICMAAFLMELCML